MNWKKVVSMLLVSAMTLSMAACGNNGTNAWIGAADSTENGSAAASGEKLVIWTLADDLIDFGERFQEQTGVEVETVVIEPANYPTKVQTALLGGETEPDIIVGEPKMLEDFYDAGFFEDLNQAPYNAQDYADQIVDYVWEIGQDSEGIQRAISYQITPAGIYYRRDIAKEVFGTDDPTAVGEKVKDWDTLKATAEELKAKGYYTFASYADTFRVYSNNMSEPWVADGETTVKIDPLIMDWVENSKEWLDAGYLDKTVKGQFNDDWNKAMGSSSKVFAFLLPPWGIDFTLNPNWDGEAGAWAVTNPPQEYNWGGSYIHAATGTDNPEHVKDIILAMTAEKDTLLKISQDYLDFTNTVSGMEEAAADDAYASDFLGGQNAYEYYAPVAENIEIAPLSAYDLGCVELFQNSFSDYFQGNVDFDKAKENFETAIKERYPDITEVEWPE